MLDHVRQRIAATLEKAQGAALATSGPAGLQAHVLPCAASGIQLYVLLPRTSDHLLTHLTQWRGLGRLRFPKIALLLTRQGYALPREQQAGCVESLQPSKPPACVMLRKVSY